MTNFAKFFSRKFLMLFLIFIAANIQIWADNISGWVWFSSMMVVGISYPLFNILEEKIQLNNTKLSLEDTVNNVIKKIEDYTELIKGSKDE